MKGRSRLDRYQNLRTGMTPNEYSSEAVDNSNTVTDNYQSADNGSSYASSAPGNNAGSNLYNTSDYSRLLQEHEDFLRSLDANFGSMPNDAAQPKKPNEGVENYINGVPTGNVPAQPVMPSPVQQPVEQPVQPQQYVNPAQPVQPQPYPAQPIVQQPYVVNGQYVQPGYVPQGQYVQPGYVPQGQYVQPGYVPQGQYVQPGYVVQQPIPVQPAVQPVVQEQPVVQPPVQPEQPAPVEPVKEEQPVIKPIKVKDVAPAVEHVDTNVSAPNVSKVEKIEREEGINPIVEEIKPVVEPKNVYNVGFEPVQPVMVNELVHEGVSKVEKKELPVTEEPISFVIDDGPLAVADIPVSVPVTPAAVPEEQLIKPITMPQMKTPAEEQHTVSSYADSIVQELEQAAEKPQVTIDYNEPAELNPYAQTEQPEPEVKQPLSISEEHYNGFVVYNNDSIPALYLDEKELVSLPEQPVIKEAEPVNEEPAVEVQPVVEEPVIEEPVIEEQPVFTVEPENTIEQVEEVLLDEDIAPVDIEPAEEEMPVIFEEPVNNDIDYVNIEETLGQLNALGEDHPFAEEPVVSEPQPEVSEVKEAEIPAEEEIPYSFASDDSEDDKFFNSINEILDNVPDIDNQQQFEPQPVEPLTVEPQQASFALEDTDTSVDDIAMAISQMDLNDYNFTEKEEEPVYQPEPQPEPVREPEYKPANEVDQPVYYDDPETVSELTEQLHTERELREEMAEQTKQLKLQMSEYENEINNANSSMTKTNKILNFVLTLLILLLFAFLLVIGYWFAQERGLI